MKIVKNFVSHCCLWSLQYFNCNDTGGLKEGSGWFMQELLSFQDKVRMILMIYITNFIDIHDKIGISHLLNEGVYYFLCSFS